MIFVLIRIGETRFMIAQHNLKIVIMEENFFGI